MSELNRETQALPGGRAEARHPLRLTLRGLLWTVFCVAFLAGSVVTAGDPQPARWFLFVFGGSLLAQAVFLNVESAGRSLHWFALGGLSAVLASGYAALLRGKLAFVHLALGGKPYNELTPAIDTVGGCILIAGGLAVICGIVVAAIHLFVLRRGHLALMSLMLLATWVLLWHAGVAAHSIR